MFKTCKTCNKILTLDSYYTNGNYLRNSCKKCENKRILKYKTGNKKTQKKDRERCKVRVKKAPDEYILKLLKIKNADKDLIEFKRLELFLKRELRKWKNIKST